MGFPLYYAILTLTCGSSRKLNFFKIAVNLFTCSRVTSIVCFDFFILLLFLQQYRKDAASRYSVLLSLASRFLVSCAVWSERSAKCRNDALKLLFLLLSKLLFC